VKGPNYDGSSSSSSSSSSSGGNCYLLLLQISLIGGSLMYQMSYYKNLIYVCNI
jgi:hypothetical protein